MFAILRRDFARDNELSSVRALRPTEDGHMARTNLIKGIDNTCDAVRRAVTWAHANGSAWQTNPLLKGIDNDDVEALRRHTAREVVILPPRVRKPSVRSW